MNYMASVSKNIDHWLLFRLPRMELIVRPCEAHVEDVIFPSENDPIIFIDDGFEELMFLERSLQCFDAAGRISGSLMSQMPQKTESFLSNVFRCFSHRLFGILVNFQPVHLRPSNERRCLSFLTLV